jgi:hypothetical protein
MTPEQIAELVRRDLNYVGDREYVIPLIAAALRIYGDARAAAERARCIQIAQITGTAHTYSESEYASGFAADDIVERIVAALRQ